MIKLVPLNNLFIPVYGVNLELVNVEECNKNDTESIRFISRTETNNGVSAYVKRINTEIPNPAHTLSVAVSGSVLSTFYQEEEYYSGRDVYYLIPKRIMSKEEMVFYAYCIRKNKYKYNYGRAANKTLKDILVPKEIPQEFSKISYDSLNTISIDSILNNKINLDTSNWKYFKIENLFSVYSSEVSSKNELIDYGIGKYPFVTGQSINNGIDGFFDYYSEKENVITIDRITFGFVGYQPLKFSANDNVKILEPKFKMNVYLGLFFSTVIMKEKYRYNYGRITSNKRLNETNLLLPAKNNEPDFEFIENYIKSLPFSKNLL